MENREALVLAVLALALLAWLWPFGIGGKMPVGGDVTQFFMGLMGVLSTALKGGRLPVWNSLWGYGFPGIGESQMGVYYPPHMILYGLLPTETAYVASLLLHTLWGGLGAWWAARQFGVSAVGAGLAAFAWSASGFFVIHFPHPWGYTTGSWMSWAWGLGWSILSSSRPLSPGRVFVLSLVLAFQLLPGHFQLAFVTESSLLLMAGWSLIFPVSRGYADEPLRPGRRLPDRLRRFLVVLGALAVGFALAAMQLLPTARLARLAEPRDFEYLSGFAATPLHLVSLVAPRLFHGSPLWRTLVWDPFHTSPEEHLAYIGLVPFFLALLAMRWWRGDVAVRVLAAVAVITLWLALGPYVPGFRFLIGLPGFSFFRAPSRWSLATSLALAILAGKGLDGWMTEPSPRRSLLTFVAFASCWIVVVLGLIELAVWSGSPGPGASPLASGFERAFQARPWTGDPGFMSVMSEARKPWSDPRIPAVLERSVKLKGPYDSRGFVQRRGEIYAAEVGATAALLLAIAGVGIWTSPKRRRMPILAVLIFIAFVDLWILGRDRPVEVGPLRPLITQSPVLARLAEMPGGTRIADSFRNLPMLVGLEPISAYRTLDLPAVESLTLMTRGPLDAEPYRDNVLKAMRITGVGVRVMDPVEIALEQHRAGSSPEEAKGATIEDSALARWLFGEKWVEAHASWGTKFRIVPVDPSPHRAWFIPLTAIVDPAMLDQWSGDPALLLRLFSRAIPVRMETTSSLSVEASFEAHAPGWLVVTQLADPQWRARWMGGAREGADAEILPTFRRRRTDGGWQRVRVPEAGKWRLSLEYHPQDVDAGLAISAASWLIWCLGLAISLLCRSSVPPGESAVRLPATAAAP